MLIHVYRSQKKSPGTYTKIAKKKREVKG